MPTTRADLRQALRYHSDGKLTSATDSDFYLNKAELDVFADWRKFDPGLFRPVLNTATTDSDGILTLEDNFTRIEYLEDTNHRQYFILSNLAGVPFGTGYIFLGADSTTAKRKIKLFLNGNPSANAAFNWYDIERAAMGSATNNVSLVPEEHRALISIRAAFLYYRDKGPAFINTKNSWLAEYEREMAKARDWYRNVSKDAQWVPSLDPDAGTARIRLQGTLP